MEQEKFKLIVKRSELNDLQRRIDSGELKSIELLGEKYILDITKSKENLEVRIYPPGFTYAGRNDGYYLCVHNQGDYEKLLLQVYTETINDIITKYSFGNFKIEIDEIR